MKNAKTLLTLLVLIISISGCKKDGSGAGATIAYKSLNLTGTATNSTDPDFFQGGIYDIPITGESNDKIDVTIVKNNSVTPTSTFFYLQPTSNQEVGFVNGTYVSKTLKVYTKDEVISSASSSWASSSNIYGYSSVLGNVDGAITPGSGDKYIGLRLKLADNTTHYGWLLLSYSANGLAVTIKEAGYNKTADESIKAGQK